MSKYQLSHTWFDQISYHKHDILHSFFKKKMGFTPCKAEQPLQGIELTKRSTKR